MKKTSLFFVFIMISASILMGASYDIRTPNGNEVFVIGNQMPIHWDTLGAAATARLEYSIDGGTNWTVIITSTPNDGDYLWTVPNAATDLCRIRLSNPALPTDNDVSDTFFTIATPVININKPNGGNVLRIGESYPIHWDWTGAFASVKIDYTIDDGVNWTSIISTTANDGEYIWTVPNFPSTGCRVRITSTVDPNCSGISESVFTIATNTINIISPNGGNGFTTGKYYPVYWDYEGTFANIKIEYSADSGSIWSSVVSTSVNDGSYYWLVPTINPSDKCLLKITNTANPACFDISDSAFAILTTGLSLLTPNGGETFVAGSGANISWNWDGTIASVRLEYSTDGGSNWKSITASAANDGSYLWTVPNEPTTNLIVRITNVADGNCLDISDGNSTLVTASINIISPNGGESLIIGEDYPVHWNWSGSFANAKLEYSTNSGTSWTTIDATDANDGSYIWTVPNAPSNQCRLRVSNVLDANANDISDLDFSIARTSINIISLNGGDILRAGNLQAIHWTSTGTVANVNIDYSANNGSTWTSIAAGTSNDGVYVWTVPNSPSAQYLIRITNSADASAFDISNAVFTVLSAGINIISPNGGETLKIGDIYPIHWNWSGNFNRIKIDYTNDGGTTWFAISASDTNDGSYNWSIPSTIIGTTQCRIRLTNISDALSQDLSDADFTLECPEINLTTLNGGETLTAGEKFAIHYNWDGSFSNVRIEYTADDGSSWTDITASTANTGDYLWTVPNTPSANCRIRVSNTSDLANSFDFSNNIFTIERATVTLLNPNGSEVFTVGQIYPITWIHTGEFANVKLEYTVNDGSTWTTIISSVANEGTYNWTVPSDISSQCRIRVSNASDALTEDQSNNMFTISPAAITLITPDGSENFTVGEYYPIEWVWTGNFNYVKLEYSINNGSTWTKLSVSDTLNDGSYIWLIPAAAVSTQCLFRVSNNIDAANTFDVTNSVFTVSSPTVTVMTPNGNDTLVIGETYPVRWSWTGAFANVKIEYTIDDLNWTSIIASTVNDGTYNWTVPAGLKSSTIKLKITSTSDGNTVDVSNNNFVSVYPSISLISPNGGEIIASGDVFPINWKNNGSIANVKIEYSSDNGFSWTNITASTANTGNYSWTSPVTVSDSFRIRVSDASVLTCFDISNDVFSVDIPSIELITLNGGDILTIGEYAPIHWNWSGSFPNVRIDYSVDGGSVWSPIDISETNDGAFNWLVPNNVTTQGRVKITNLSDANSFDISTADFAILKPAFTIFDPDSGKQFICGLKYPIHWNYTGAVDSVIIELLYKVSGVVQSEFISNSAINSGSFVFSVPNYISDTCWIKIASTADDSIYSISERFSIKRPEYSIVEANGGEQYYPGEAQEIIWDWRGGPDTVGIQFSYDGGLNYTTIKPKEFNDGSYNWVSPSIYVSNYLLKVFSAEDNNAFDISNATYQVLYPVMTITTPSEANIVYTSNYFPVYWDYRGTIDTLRFEIINVTDGDSFHLGYIHNREYNLFYAADSLVSDGDRCMVKAFNKLTGYLYDISDTFTVLSKDSLDSTFDVIFPNIGDSMFVDEAYYVIWNSDTSVIKKIDILRSIDGITYFYQAANVENVGYYTFTVPHDQVSSNYHILVNAKDSLGAIISSEDIGPMKVKPSEIRILTPNSSKELFVGRPYNINWQTVKGIFGSAQLYYCADGSTWLPLITSTLNDGNYEWLIPNIPSNNVRIAISEFGNSAATETSEVFVVKPQEIYITYPILTDTFIVGRDYYVTWYNEGGVDSVEVQYSVNGGTNWNSMGVIPNNENYKWTIPNYPSNHVLIKVVDTKNSNVNSISDTFTIIRPTITITSPVSASDWISGRNYYIDWDYTGKFSNVKLTYSTNNGTNWALISSSTANSQNYLWTLPTFDTDSAIVRVANDIDTTIFSQTSMFEILPQAITVIYPSLSESLTAGKNYRISWTYTGVIDTVIVEYSTDNGTSWNSPVKVLASSRSYQWTAPNTVTDIARIRVSNKNLASLSFGVSSLFSIINKQVLVSSPSAGESYTVGDKCMITWDYSGGANDSVVAAYSINGGTSWTLLDTLPASTQYYEWTLPNLPSANTVVQVYSLRMTSSFDNSGTFTIAPQSVNIISPASLSSWTSSKKYFLVWDNTGAFSNVDLEYSANGGGVWQTIASSAVNNKYYEWTVPSNSTVNALVRISNSSNTTVNATSSAFELKHPTILVFSPSNTDSLYIGTKRYITWQSSMGTADSVVLSYSVNGGSTYTAIDTLAASLRAFKWTVPNFSSTNCLIRISGYENPAVIGTSSMFSILDQQLFVTSQYLNENYTSSKRYYLTWNYRGGIDTLSAEYSINGGSTWNLISSSIVASNQNYEWNPVPNVYSSLCFIKLTNKTRTSVNDLSSQFTVNPQSIQVNSPAPASLLTVGNKYYITWANTGTITNVNIDYSIDNGVIWTSAASNIVNAKYYEWTVPDFISDSVLVRVSSYADATINDNSGLFSIAGQSIQIASPDTTSSWMLTKKYAITWQNTGSVANVKLQYSLDGGNIWNSIIETTPNLKYYEWTVPTTAAVSSLSLINVSNVANTSIESSSDTFDIVPQGISVVSPEINSQFVVSRKYYISWLTSGTVSTVNVYYSVNGGTDWNLITSNLTNTGYYEWTVPNAPSAQALIRITNSSNESILGESGQFNIVPQTIIVNSPVNADNWIIGRKYYLTWSNVGAIATVRLQYSYNNGIDWNLITDNLTNSGSYEWTVPNTPSESCYVRVINYSNTNVYGSSAQFNIPSQTVNILSPISSDEYLSGNKYYITWRWDGTVSTVDIEYSTDNGAGWTYAATGIANNGYYEWTVPTANSTECLVRVKSSSNANVFDISNAFTILPQQITITSPSSSDTMIAGRKYYLTWRSKGAFSNADLWYSINGGTSWDIISANEPNDGSYEWTIPTAPSNNALVKISNSSQSAIFSVSDMFVVSEPLVTFTSPVFGNVFETTKKYFFTWTVSGTVAQFNIDISYNGGTDWTQIIPNLNNTGSYEWTIPRGSFGTHCRMKLTSSANSAISYVSDSFAISVFSGIKELSWSIAPIAENYNMRILSSNSFDNMKEIYLEIPNRSSAEILLYDASGRFVKSIYNGTLEKGFHSIKVSLSDNSGRELMSGIYFVKVAVYGGKDKGINKVQKLLKIR